MRNETMVSINLITYNHENYIRDAIESILMQKTDFEFEILVHDDASIDNTAEIITEYEKKNPNIIKTILQKENQYSKGVNVGEINRRRARGKYIAECEGDDYWTDENKLQRQVDYLESNPKCTFCFHNATVIDEENNEISKVVIPWLHENRKFYYSQSKEYRSGELQLLGFIPTASFMYPKYVLDNPPQWFFDAPVGDNAIKLLASSKGYSFYIDDTMSIYRFNVPNSATTKWASENSDNSIERCNNFIGMLNEFNKYSGYKYDKEIQLSKLTWKVQQAKLTSNSKQLKIKDLREYIELLSLKDKLSLYLVGYCPLGYKIIKDLISKKRLLL